MICPSEQTRAASISTAKTLSSREENRSVPSLACAVVSQQAGDLVGPQLQADVGYRRHRSVALPEALSPENRRSGRILGRQLLLEVLLTTM